MNGKMVTKAMAASFAALIATSALMPPADAAAPKKISSELSVTFNGGIVLLPQDSKPFMHSNRIQLPMRYLFEALGAQVQYDGSTKTIYAIHEGTEIRLQIGCSEMVVGNQTIHLDSPALLNKSKTFLPVRAISEALGAEVEWFQAQRTANITSPLYSVPAPAPESLDNSVRERVKQRSPSEQAALALHWLYTGNVGEGPYIAEELQSYLSEVRKSLPEAKKIWLQEVQARQIGDNFMIGTVILGENEEGLIKQYGSDLVEVSMLSDKTGYYVTGYSHMQYPSAKQDDTTRIWIGYGSSSYQMPREITVEIPSAIVKNNETMLPVEILKSIGNYGIANDGTYFVTLPNGEKWEGIRAVSIERHAFIPMADFVRKFDNMSVIEPGQSTTTYSVHWSPELKQLRIDIESYHPIS